MAEASLALVFLRLAGDDSRACRTLAADPQMSDAIVGFHAHQSIEKSLKAVLAAASVDFRHTHDLAELLDRLTDEGLPPPPHAEHLDELNPYAVPARCGLVGQPAAAEPGGHAGDTGRRARLDRPVGPRYLTPRLA